MQNVVTNDANNYLVCQISRTVFAEVRTAASAKASRSFLDRIFISFSGIHDATRKAAEGADKLKGAGELEKGSRKVAAGTRSLAEKAKGAAGALRPYLKDNGGTIADTARQVANSSGAMRDNLAGLVKGAPLTATAAHQASADPADIHRTGCEESDEPDPAACPPLERARTAAADAARVADDVNALVTESSGDLTTLDGRLAKLQKQATALAERAPHPDDDLTTAVTEINRLDSGAMKVAKGADELHTGLATAKKGSTGLDAGIGKLGTGAAGLDGGLFKRADGSADLAGGLDDGVGEIPDYGKSDRDLRTEVMADPVRLASRSTHEASNYGTGFAPHFIPLSLWVGAMVAYTLIQPLNRRALAAGAAPWRIAVAGWLPVVGIGLLQVGALMSVLHWDSASSRRAPPVRSASWHWSPAASPRSCSG